MDSVFSDLTGKYLHVYIDDLLIYSQTFEEHLRHFEIILKRLSDAGLRASLEKTLWFVSSLPYLGYILHQGHVSMDPEKVKDALAFQLLTKPSVIHQVLLVQRHSANLFVSFSVSLVSIVSSS